MKKSNGELLGLLATAMLLLLTAWGNALAMAVISGVGSVVALAVLAWRAPGWRVFWWRFFGVNVAFGVSAAIAFAVEILSRNR